MEFPLNSFGQSYRRLSPATSTMSLQDRFRVPGDPSTSALQDRQYVTKAAHLLSCSQAQDGRPVRNLLQVSLQFRQATLEVLAKSLDIPLIKEGIWRQVLLLSQNAFMLTAFCSLTKKPFTIIARVRKMYHVLVLTSREVIRHPALYDLDSRGSLPAVLAVYWGLKATDLLVDDWCGARSLRIAYPVDTARHGPYTARVVADLERALPLCLPEAQDLLRRQVHACLARHAVGACAGTGPVCAALTCRTVSQLVAPFSSAERACRDVARPDLRQIRDVNEVSVLSRRLSGPQIC